MLNRWVSVSDFLVPALDIGKNTYFANEWQWFHDSWMPTGRVIGNQRFDKVTKKANQYPQIWHVNLETLSFCCLVFVKTETKQNKKKKKKKLMLIFSEIFSCQWLLMNNTTLCRKKNDLRTVGAKVKKWLC